MVHFPLRKSRRISDLSSNEHRTPYDTDNSDIITITIDPRFIGLLISFFQLLFSLICLVTTSIYIERIFHYTFDWETSVLLGLAFGLFIIQIIIASCSLYGIYHMKLGLILINLIWHLVTPVVYAILCILAITKFIHSDLLISYILSIVMFVVTPLFVLDTFIIAIYYKCYEVAKKERRRPISDEGQSNLTPLGQQDDYFYPNPSSVPTAVTRRALLPPTTQGSPIRALRRNQAATGGGLYAISNLADTQYRRITAGSYMSVRWTGVGNLDDLVHQETSRECPYFLKLEDGPSGTHTEA